MLLIYYFNAEDIRITRTIRLFYNSCYVLQHAIEDIETILGTTIQNANEVDEQ